jgi:hypothetical protein
LTPLTPLTEIPIPNPPLGEIIGGPAVAGNANSGGAATGTGRAGRSAGSAVVEKPGHLTLVWRAASGESAMIEVRVAVHGNPPAMVLPPRHLADALEIDWFDPLPAGSLDARRLP